MRQRYYDFREDQEIFTSIEDVCSGDAPGQLYLLASNFQFPDPDWGRVCALLRLATTRSGWETTTRASSASTQAKRASFTWAMFGMRSWASGRLGLSVHRFAPSSACMVCTRAFRSQWATRA